MKKKKKKKKKKRGRGKMVILGKKAELCLKSGSVAVGDGEGTVPPCVRGGT